MIGIRSLIYLLNNPFINVLGFFFLKNPIVNTKPLRIKNMDTQKCPSNKKLK
jgi:hypothetical protein